MAGRIVRDDIDALRERADIADVVGDHTKLTRAGSRMKGLCPFHQEKTPSFTVDPGRSLYHCFGCGVGGDVYSFLMRIEGLEFHEAVEQLARRSGYTLRYEDMSAGEKQALGQRSLMVGVMAAAHAFFRAALYSDEGEVARDYLKSRGFGREDADHFELGYAPNEWEALSRHLVRDGFDQRDLIRVGVAQDNKRGGVRDSFRGRLIFPVHDQSGDVIGFGGRVLPELDYGDFDPPKYYNSPETPLYHKSRVLYALPQARPEIVRAGEVLICEGYTDVMALHQAGFGNAVATCGTAVGKEHLRLLSHFAQRVVLAFDADAAGFKAAQRAWEEARQLETEQGNADGETHTFDLRVLILPAGLDPADFVRKEGVDAVREAVTASRHVVPFLIEQRIAQFDLGTDEGRTMALRESLEILRDEPDHELRRAWARSEVADRVGVSIEFVSRTAERMGVALDRHEGVATVTPSQAGRRGAVAPLDRRRARRERELLRHALQQPDLLPNEWDQIVSEDFSHPTARSVFSTLQEAGGPGSGMDKIFEAAPDDAIRTIIREMALEETEVEPTEDGVAALVRWLLVDRIEVEQATLREALSQLNHTTDRSLWVSMNEQLADLERRRRALIKVEP